MYVILHKVFRLKVYFFLEKYKSRKCKSKLEGCIFFNAKYE